MRPLVWSVCVCPYVRVHVCESVYECSVVCVLLYDHMDLSMHVPPPTQIGL